MKNLICKIFKHYPEVYPYQAGIDSIPEPRYACGTCGQEFESPEMEDYAGIGIPIHRLINFIKDIKQRFDFRYRDIPF